MRRALPLLTLAALLAAGAARGETLAEAVTRTVASFPELRAAAANRRAVEETVTQARALRLPSLDGTLGGGRERSDNPTARALVGAPTTLSRNEAEITLSQLLFDGGAASSQIRRQEARSESAAAQVASIAESAALRAAQAFFDVLRLRESIMIARQNLAVHRRTLEQVMLRTERGVGRRSDDRQAEARLALAQSQLTQLTGLLDEAEAAYRHVTGKPPGELVRGATPFGALPRNAQSAVDEALASHPAVRAAELALQAALEDREAARGGLWPRVTLELGATQNRDIDGQAGLNADRTAMLRLRHNFFRGGGDVARIREAEARRDEALAQLARARNDVERDVRQAWDNLASARERLAALRLHAEASAEVVEAYRAQFSIGQRSLLDVLNSENELYSARASSVAGEYQVAAGAYRLLSAMGRMLQHLGIKSPNSGSDPD